MKINFIKKIWECKKCISIYVKVIIYVKAITWLIFILINKYRTISIYSFIQYQFFIFANLSNVLNCIWNATESIAYLFQSRLLHEISVAILPLVYWNASSPNENKHFVTDVYGCKIHTIKNNNALFSEKASAI